MSVSEKRENLIVLLAAPRGFCAGVGRAIDVVERALEKYGAPVYVRHEIVHNKYVVDSLRSKGAVFVDELEEVEDKSRPVIFSAHGVPKSIPEKAEDMNMLYIDATCPLVSKVHKEAVRYFKQGQHIILIGHAGHPEVIGTMGQLPKGAVSLIETIDDVASLAFNAQQGLSYCTQTTLSVEDTSGIISALKACYPDIQGPHKEDICYATTNRQEAVRAIAPDCDAVIVIGAPNSSNSNRLVEAAALHGCKKSKLVQRGSDIDWEWMKGVKTLGITAGASAPEVLVDEVVETLRGRYDVTLEEREIKKENVRFNVPKILSGE